MAQIAYIKDHQTGPVQLRTELRRAAQSFRQLIAELLELQAECESNGKLGAQNAEVEYALCAAQKSLQGLNQAIAAYEQSPATSKAGDLR